MLGEGREWDVRDRLVSGGYGYDTGNLRVKMGEQEVLLDGIEEAREYGTEVKRYDHDPSRVDGLLAQKTGTGKGYFVTDALGSVYGVVDASGAVVSKYGYDVYGARTATVEGLATSWGFTGRRHDSGTEMYYRARYRDVGSGGWIAADPFASHPFAPEIREALDARSIRRTAGSYAYVDAAPTNTFDPTGLVPVWNADITFGTIGERMVSSFGLLSTRNLHTACAPHGWQQTAEVFAYFYGLGIPLVPVVPASITFFNTNFEVADPAFGDGNDFTGFAYVVAIFSAAWGPLGHSLQRIRLGGALSIASESLAPQTGFDLSLIDIFVGVSLAWSTDSRLCCP